MGNWDFVWAILTALIIANVIILRAFHILKRDVDVYRDEKGTPVLVHDGDKIELRRMESGQDWGDWDDINK